MNNDIKLTVSSWHGLNPGGSSIKLVGNKLIFSMHALTLDETVEVTREIELTEEEMEKIKEILNDFVTNKEEYEKQSRQMIFDYSNSIDAEINGNSISLKNIVGEGSIYDRILEVLDDMLKSRDPEAFNKMGDELYQLKKEAEKKESYPQIDINALPEEIKLEDNGENITFKPDFSSFELEFVETEEEAKNRIAILFRLLPENVPSECILFVQNGIDSFGPVSNVVTDVPRNPRKFTDEEIKEFVGPMIDKKRAEMLEKSIENEKPMIEQTQEIQTPYSGREYGVESEASARARVARVLQISEEEVPYCHIVLVTSGIDKYGPIDDVITDVPRGIPRPFTDEEIKKYATEERVERWKKLVENISKVVKSSPKYEDDLKETTGKEVEPINVLKEKYPSFFDENGNMKASAVELIDLLVENYAKPKEKEQEAKISM